MRADHTWEGEMWEGLRFPAEAEAAEVCLGQRGGGVRNTERSRLVGERLTGPRSVLVKQTRGERSSISSMLTCLWGVQCRGSWPGSGASGPKLALRGENSPSYIARWWACWPPSRSSQARARSASARSSEEPLIVGIDYDLLRICF